MKSFIGFIIFSSLLLGLTVSGVMSADSTLRIFAESEEIASLEVLEIQEAKYVSLREIRELFSGTWKSETLIGRITVTIMGKRIILTLNQNRLAVDDKEYILSNPPVSVSGKVVVPVEFLTEIMPSVIGKQITLDQEKWVLQISGESLVKDNGLAADSHVPSEPASTGFRVIIDPGHGGYDAGARSKAGLFEKNLTLRIALQMKNLLAEREDLHIYLTRREDNYMTPAERVNSANKLRGHVFLSIHFNSSPSQRSSGYRIYVSSNRMRLGTGFDLEADVFSRSRPATDKPSEVKRFLPQSKWLAKEVADRLRNTGLTGEQHKEAFLAAMDNLSMPAVLVEILYLSNPQDLKIISRPDFIDSVSQALCDSILAFKSFLQR